MNNTDIPKHLVSLGSENWYIWRWIALRGAGFPASQVLALADTQCTNLADEYLEYAAIADEARDEAKHLLWQKLKDVSDFHRRKSIRKAIRQLEKGNAPLESVKQAEKIIEKFREANMQADELKAKFQDAFQDAAVQNMQTIRKLAGNASFQEAIIWQNGKVLSGIKSFLNKPLDPTRPNRQRYREAKIASYLHRYCMKNDTIGFFGPVAWTRVVEQDLAINFQAGDTLLAERNTYFELWGIDTLAQTLSENEAILPWCSPRRLPLFDIDDVNLYVPFASVTKLTPTQAIVFKSCDGEHTAKQLATTLVGDASNDLNTEADVYEVLRSLKDMRLIEWALEIPLESLYPERSLRRQLERIEDENLRQQTLETLNKLEAQRYSIIQSRKDPEKLNRAFRELETTFSRLTNTAPTRRAGQIYAGRTLTYEDCRRNTVVDISPKMLDSLGPPLALLLTSARWFSFKAAAIYRKAFRQIYSELAQKTGSSVISFPTMWMQLQSMLFDEDARFMRALERELQKRWLAIFRYNAEQRHAQYSASELNAEVLKVFSAPHPGWKAACYHSPDIMVMAKDLEAIQQGDFHWILGELHAAANTLDAWVWVAQHPASQDLLRSVEADLPFPLVRFVASREVITPRRAAALIKPNDYRFVVANDSCGVPSSQALLAGTLVVKEVDGDLFVQRRDGSLHFEIIEFLGDVLSRAILHHFNFIPPMEHMPRISIDRLVVHRETWQFAPEESSFAFQKEESERFLQARRWALINKLPRFLFVKTPTNEKPFYVDLASPVSVDLLTRAIRRTYDSSKEASIEVTEMLPDPYQTWLLDDVGNKYTSEFRMVIVDRI